MIDSVSRRTGSGRPSNRTAQNIKIVNFSNDPTGKQGTCQLILKKTYIIMYTSCNFFNGFFQWIIQGKWRQWFQNNLNNENTLNTVSFSDDYCFYLSEYGNSQNSIIHANT